MASRRSSGRSSRERARPTPEQLSERLGVVLDPETLSLALTHRSYAYENGRLPTNERLEFLGDSVLGFLVTSHLYEIHPERSEGDLAKMRASVVSTRALAAVARSISLGGHIRLGEGELRTGGQDKDSILADTMEALIGGTYLDHGLDAAHDLVHRLVAPMLDDERAMGLGTDWKTHIQEAASAGDLGEIEYRIEAQGPDHQKTFTATLVVGGKTYASGTGTSKKDAEREAAAASCDDVRADAGLSDSGQLPESDLP